MNEKENVVSELSMVQSADTKDLFAALSKMQGMMKPAVFNRINPHFKSKYADFASCMDACRDPLSQCGLSVFQFCEMRAAKPYLGTMLSHVSGQWILTYMPLYVSNINMQSLGSAITYAKRYALTAALGIVADEEVDDDAEKSVGRDNHPQEHKKTSTKNETPKIGQTQIMTLKALDEKLDKDAKTSIYTWLSQKYKSFEDIVIDDYQEVFQALSNAVKYVEQQKIEQKEAVHA